MEGSNSKCFLCLESCDYVEHGGFKQTLVSITNYLTISLSNEDKPLLCDECYSLLATFNELYKSLEIARIKVNCCLKQIREVMIEGDRTESEMNINLGCLAALRERIIQKSLSQLRKSQPTVQIKRMRFLATGHDTASLISNVSNPKETKPTSHFKPKSVAGEQPEESNPNKKLHPLQKRPLPDHIKKKGIIWKYNRKQPLYHCNSCKEDFPSVFLPTHRKHGNQTTSEAIKVEAPQRIRSPKSECNGDTKVVKNDGKSSSTVFDKRFRRKGSYIITVTKNNASPGKKSIYSYFCLRCNKNFSNVTLHRRTCHKNDLTPKQLGEKRELDQDADSYSDTMDTAQNFEAEIDEVSQEDDTPPVLSPQYNDVNDNNSIINNARKSNIAPYIITIRNQDEENGKQTKIRYYCLRCKKNISNKTSHSRVHQKNDSATMDADTTSNLVDEVKSGNVPLLNPAINVTDSVSNETESIPSMIPTTDAKCNDEPYIPAEKENEKVESGKGDVTAAKIRPSSLPDHILRKGRTVKYNRKQPLYHCLGCCRNFVSSLLPIHRKHVPGHANQWNLKPKKLGRPLIALPDHIQRKGSIFKYNKKQCLFHCSTCNKDFIASLLAIHRKHLPGFENQSKSKPKKLGRPMTRPLPEHIQRKGSVFKYNKKQSLFHCSTCNTDFISSLLAIHRKHLSGSEIQPSSKPKKLGRPQTLTIPEHIQRKGSIVKYNRKQGLFHCSTCNKDFISSTFAIHRKHVPGIQQPLPQPGKVRNLKRSLPDHVQRKGTIMKHNKIQPLYHCNTCDKEFTSSLLPIHRKHAPGCQNQQNLNHKKLGRPPTSSLPEHIQRKGSIFKYNKKQCLYHCLTCNKDFISSLLAIHRKHVPGYQRQGYIRTRVLPDHIQRKGTIMKYNRIQPLYHCSGCEKDFPSSLLPIHRKHAPGFQNQQNLKPKKLVHPRKTYNLKRILPDHIQRKGTIMKYNRIQPLYHCTGCNREFASTLLPLHRKHTPGYQNQQNLQTKNLASPRKAYNLKRKLPDHIERKGTTMKYNRIQPLYHCNACDREFPSILLPIHRKHGLGKQNQEPSNSSNGTSELVDIDEIPSQSDETSSFHSPSPALENMKSETLESMQLPEYQIDVKHEISENNSICISDVKSVADTDSVPIVMNMNNGDDDDDDVANSKYVRVPYIIPMGNEDCDTGKKRRYYYCLRCKKAVTNTTLHRRTYHTNEKTTERLEAPDPILPEPGENEN